MRVIIQRCNEGSVSIDNKIYNKINKGMVLLVGFTQDDNINDINYMVKKIINLRIYDDENGIMNKSILDIKGEVLSISQFTLYANTKKGNRPSYIQALNGHDAIKLYDLFNQELLKFLPVKTGVFGSDMLVNINNDGPVTIYLDSKN